MFKLKQSLLAFAGLALVIGLVTLVSPSPTQGQGGGKPPTDVNVINTPSVNVVNATLPVRDVDNPARQPFQAFFHIPFSTVSNGDIAVPAGKRLVIEFASIDVGVAPACRVASLSISTIVAGVGATYYIPTSHITTATGNVDLAAQQVRIYADPGTHASVNYPTIGDNCNQVGGIAISGYLVNVP